MPAPPASPSRQPPSHLLLTPSTDIYARHGGTAALPKEPGLNSAPPDFPRGLFNAQDGAPHARQRRIFGPAFTNTALRAQEPLLRGHVRKLVANVRRACAEGAGAATVNMADLFGFLTFDVMADLAFGAPLGLLDAGVYSPWVRNVFAGRAVAVSPAGEPHADAAAGVEGGGGGAKGVYGVYV